jgi:hypothetical protein
MAEGKAGGQSAVLAGSDLPELEVGMVRRRNFPTIYPNPKFVSVEDTFLMTSLEIPHVAGLNCDDLLSINRYRDLVNPTGNETSQRLQRGSLKYDFMTKKFNFRIFAATGIYNGYICRGNYCK